MSDPGVKNIDPFSIAVFNVIGAPDISKQQLVDALVLVINGKITQSWEHSNGMTREKTELIQAKKELSELSFNGWEDSDNAIATDIQGIFMKLTVFKRRKAEQEARQKAEEEARQKAEQERQKAEQERQKAAQDALGGDDGAVDLPEDPTQEDEYNDYSSSN